MAAGICKGLQRDLSPGGPSEAQKPLIKMKTSHEVIEKWDLIEGKRQIFGRHYIIELTQTKNKYAFRWGSRKSFIKKKISTFEKKPYSSSNIFEFSYASC